MNEQLYMSFCFIYVEFPEPAIKGVLKHLLLTLGCYNDRKSRRAVNHVIQTLSSKQSDKLIKHFSLIMEKSAEQQKLAKPR